MPGIKGKKKLQKSVYGENIIQIYMNIQEISNVIFWMKHLTCKFE